MLLYFLILSSNQLNLSRYFKCPSLVFPCSESIPPTCSGNILVFLWWGMPPRLACDSDETDFISSTDPSVGMWLGLNQCIPPPWPWGLVHRQTNDLNLSHRWHSGLFLKLVNQGALSWKLPVITVMGKAASNGANPKESRAERWRGTMSWGSCSVPESATPEARDTLIPFSYKIQ